MAAPNLDLSTILSPKPAPASFTIVSCAPSGTGITKIDINSTVVTDGENTAYLSSLIKKIKDNKLMLDAEATISDGKNEAVFDFEYDETGKKFGTGTVFF